MKLTCTTLLLMLAALPALGQIKGAIDANGKYAKENVSTNLLPHKAFDKMIIQDITYTIFGESSPVSGIKIDISKPEATISGVFLPKNLKTLLIGLEFKGGITDKSFSIFKGLNDFNTAFECRPSLHWIPSWNKAKYYTANKPVLLAKNELVVRRTTAITDTFHAIARLYNEHLTNFSGAQHTDPPLSVAFNTAQADIMIYFIKKITGSSSPLLVNTNGLAVLLTCMPQAQVLAPGEIDIATYYNELVDTYHKYLKLYNGSEEEELTRQINNVSKAWSHKKYWWFTFSPFARTEKITEHHTKFEGRDSLYFKPNYPFYYGINAMINRYHIWPNKIALFWRFGLTLAKANNINTLSSFNYETRTPFFSSGTSATEKVKTGTAYNYEQVKSGFASQVNAEIYLLPLRTFFPGIYFSSSINNSKLYTMPDMVGRANDKTMIPMEGGLVFNINSREKDKEKNILSLSVYTKFEDITDKRRTAIKDNKEETREDFMKRNFSVGIKVGIPITLPQRAD